MICSIIIIPTLNPDNRLISYVNKLIMSGFKNIILVNDGSDLKCQWIFDTISLIPECEVLTHAINMGKGRALKNAFNYYSCKYSKKFNGVITVDSDGQHAIEDVVRINAELEENQEALILGVRDFDNPFVPIKSSAGNKITKQVMNFFIGGSISDTQTGLRAIPNTLINSYLTLFGERFEYETAMIIKAIHSHTSIREVRIQTIYLNENIQTHFRPIKDSYAIYKYIFSTFFRYSIASLSSFMIDYVAFCAFTYLFVNMTLIYRIWCSTLAARIISSIFNYTYNKNIVFMYVRKSHYTLLRYYAICMLQLCFSATFVWIICKILDISESAVKPFVDTLLFLISYKIQKWWVFKEV